MTLCVRWVCVVLALVGVVCSYFLNLRLPARCHCVRLRWNCVGLRWPALACVGLRCVGVDARRGGAAWGRGGGCPRYSKMHCVSQSRRSVVGARMWPRSKPKCALFSAHSTGHLPPRHTQQHCAVGNCEFRPSFGRFSAPNLCFKYL
jgi:hypothetical protein